MIYIGAFLRLLNWFICFYFKETIAPALIRSRRA